MSNFYVLHTNTMCVGSSIGLRPEMTINSGEKILRSTELSELEWKVIYRIGSFLQEYSV